MEGLEGINSRRYWKTNVGVEYANKTDRKTAVSDNNDGYYVKGLIRHDKSINNMLKNHVAATALGVAIISPAIILLSKGKFSRNMTQWMTRGVNKLSDLSNNLKDKSHSHILESFYLSSLQKMTKALGVVRGSILQITPLKDALFLKALKKMHLEGVGNKITHLFEKAAITMMNKSYDKSAESFSLMQKTCKETNKALREGSANNSVSIQGVSKTVSEWADIADGKLKHIDKNYDFFRPEQIKSRQQSLLTSMTGLGDKIYDLTYGNYKNFFFDPKKLTTFISEDLVSGFKLKQKKEVLSKKKLITNTASDFSGELAKTIKDIETSLDLTDKQSLEILKNIKRTVSGYSKGIVNRKNGITKEDALEQINNIVKENRSYIASRYTPTTSKKITEAMKYIQVAISENKPGELEELLQIYKHTLPEDSYKALAKVIKKSSTGLGDAVDVETDRFVDKVRDLKAGSALTDVAHGLIVPTLSTGIGMSMADTKEKRRSVVLKLGVPLVVGVGVSTIATLALLSAGPSMVLGLTTSLITSKVCAGLDKYLKNKSAKQSSAKV